jgi:oligoribonuclease
MATPRFVWLDLEMTGLDPATCAVVEIGIIVTGADLVPLDEWASAVWQPEEVLARMGPFVRDMHTRNGLLDRVRASTLTVEDAERQALALVSRHFAYGEAVLAGNSIHHDRRFLRRYLPAFERFLHYRQLDVSSLKVLCQAWYGEERQFAKQSKSHTALDDLHQSLAELAHYRSEIFRLAGRRTHPWLKPGAVNSR